MRQLQTFRNRILEDEEVSDTWEPEDDSVAYCIPASKENPPVYHPVGRHGAPKTDQRVRMVTRQHLLVARLLLYLE